MNKYFIRFTIEGSRTQIEVSSQECAKKTFDQLKKDPYYEDVTMVCCEGEAVVMVS